VDQIGIDEETHEQNGQGEKVEKVQPNGEALTGSVNAVDSCV
jgi:hypothetical protein